jgi:hypothetical protein
MRLGYYTNRFPFPQGASAGPYGRFAPPALQSRVACVMVTPPGSVPAMPNHASRRHKHGACGCHSKGLCKCHAPGRRHGYSRSNGVPRTNLHGLGDDTAGLPAGSSLVYSVSWNEPAYIGPSSSSVSANVKNLATSSGIVIDSISNIGALAAGNGFTASLHTTSDFGQAADVQSILDHLVYTLVGSYTGGMPQSTITTAALAQAQPASTPASGTSASLIAQYAQNYNDAIAAGDSASASYWQSLIAGAVPATQSSILTWAQNNPLYVAGGILAAVLVWRMA